MPNKIKSLTSQLPQAAISLAVFALVHPAFAASGDFEVRVPLQGLSVSAPAAGGSLNPSGGGAPVTAPARLELSTGAVDFGSVATHTTETRQVLATNTGEQGLLLTAAPAVSGDAPFGAGATDCGPPLAQGQSCLTEVRFSPTTPGAYSGVLTFTSTLANSPHQVTLQGTAFNPVSLAATTLPEATVGQAYSFDFKPLLNVSNEASPDRSLATWSVLSGTLPAGLSVNSATGILSGTPSSPTAGASFTVQGTYKNNQGQRVFTIVVNGVSLRVAQLAAGAAHTCALTEDATVVCWGSNGFGQLGNGTTTSSSQPTPVQGLQPGVKAITAGDSHTCAIAADNFVFCWGRNTGGQLGNGTNTNSAVPVPVSVSTAVGAGLGSGVLDISAGHSHTCAVLITGQVRCWGAGSAGQLGTSNTTYWNVPWFSGTRPGGSRIGNALAVAAGAYHTCVLTTTASNPISCWGRNSEGQLGTGSTSTSSALAVNYFGGVSSPVQISAGAYHTCARSAAGGAFCWGFNGDGALGIGNTTNQSRPTAVSGLSTGVADLVAGARHTCAVTADGSVVCWGRNSSGQLGLGSSANSLTPAAVVGLPSAATGIALGGTDNGSIGHSCATLATGQTYCWGSNGFGQLGDGTTTQRLTPVEVQF